MKVNEIIAHKINEGFWQGIADFVSKQGTKTLATASEKETVEAIAKAITAKGGPLTSDELKQMGVNPKFIIDPSITKQAQSLADKQLVKQTVSREFKNLINHFAWLSALDVTLQPFYVYNQKMNKYDELMKAGKDPFDHTPEENQKLYDSLRQKEMSVAVGECIVGLAAAALQLGPGVLIGKIPYFGPFYKAMSAAGLIFAENWLVQSPAGRALFIDIMANDAENALHLDTVFGAVPLAGLDKFKSLIPWFNSQGQKTAPAAGQKPTASTTSGQGVSTAPVDPSKSAKSYNSLGQYTPITQGVTPEPDKSKWKDIGGNMIQDPITGQMDWKFN